MIEALFLLAVVATLAAGVKAITSFDDRDELG